MNRPAHLSEETIFNVACLIPSGEARAACVDQLCGNDPALKKRVLVLLQADSNTFDLLDGSSPEGPGPTQAANPARPAALVENAIGPYKILQQIGEGGMGVVYMAEQTAPVKRRVAIKIIKPGLDDKQVIARFEAERQALAMMDHPNVAKVLEAGATPSGRPYFVMDLVKGIPINEYCDEHRLSTHERLKLFTHVCRGVQHAHHKGVIHRDIKPSNVLVAQFDHQPVPKIIDFGVAKATNHELTEKTLFTQFGQIVGTLDYMSPEQAKFNQLDIDLRSDIYSLGVLLFELLTGGTPIEKERVRTSGLDEILRIIREEEPPRPSTRLSSSATRAAIAAMRSTDSAKLTGLLREELDWIVLKAMAKERNDRYQSADALADDIERHLNHLPITARRPSLAGRARRFAKRHKAALAIAGLILLTAVLGSAFAGFAYIRGAKDKQQRAALLASQSETVAVRAQAAKQQQARREVLPRIKQLIHNRRPLEAFALASEVRPVIAEDPEFQAAWEILARPVSFLVEPVGTTISYRDPRDPDAEWTVIGATPLQNVEVPNCALRMRYESPGYERVEFQRPRAHWNLKAVLRNTQAPEGMTFIPGGQPKPTPHGAVSIGSFYIDTYEVSNQEFKAFVDAGGYERQEFWSGIEFVRDGEPIPWEEAIRHFVDASQVTRGPAQWRGGEFPEGEANYPVGGVSWYEAQAYARFVNKSLPTIAHWTLAALTKQPGITTSLSNFSGQGPAPRGANTGIGHFEVYDMAGNHKEWCFNENHLGDRCMKGGAWNESDYRFHFNDFVSPWNRSPSHGFRCVQFLGRKGPEKKAVARIEKLSTWIPVGERAPLELLQWWYKYDAFPLEPVQIQRDDPADRRSPDYRHEIIRINTGYDEGRFDLHLFVPHRKNANAETIVYMPGAGAWTREKFVVRQDVDWRYVEDLARSGRIVCYPIYKGIHDRSAGKDVIEQFKERPMKAVRDLIAVSLDASRAVDYLLTRDDVDPERLVYFGLSLGALRGPPTVATDSRFKAAVFLAAGYQNGGKQVPMFHPFHFMPHVKVPVLMLNGAGDNMFDYETSQRPFFEDLGTSNKEHRLLVGDHNPPPEDVFKHIDQWLRQIFPSAD